MKKQIITIMALVFAFQLANAQTEKGRQNIGINLGYSYIKNTDVIANPGLGISQDQYSKVVNFSIGPDYSYFIADNLDLGVNLNYNNSTQEYSNTSMPNKSTVSGYGGSLYLRKYFLYNGKLGFRTGGRIGYGHTDSKFTYTTTSAGAIDEKANTVYGGLLLDLVYYPTKKLGVAASIANATYSHAKVDNGNATDGSANSFAFNFINNGLSLSVFYTFGK